MAPRSQPYRVTWPLTPPQMEDIDQMFQILFDDIRNDAIFPTTTEGDMMYRDKVRVVRLAIGQPNTVLRTDGIIPMWGKVNLASGGETTGTLPVTGGGTGVTSFPVDTIIIGGTTTTGPLQSIAIGTAGQILTSQGPGLPPIFTDRPLDYVVLSDGGLPTPEPIDDGFGNFIYVPYTP